VSDNLITRTADPMDRVKHDADDPNPCPPLNAAEYDALKRSIQDDGYIPAFPVVISAGPACDGQIIDGFHRSRVCAELGIEPIRIYHPCATELEFKILQIKANLERRQLSPAQRGILAVRLLPLYEERAKVRMVAGVADPVIPGSQGRAPRSVDQVAEAAGVSSATVTRMKAIMESEQADTLLDAITSQGKSVKAAYESLRPAKEQAALDTSISNEDAAAGGARGALLPRRRDGQQRPGPGRRRRRAPGPRARRPRPAPQPQRPGHPRLQVPPAHGDRHLPPPRRLGRPGGLGPRAEPMSRPLQYESGFCEAGNHRNHHLPAPDADRPHHHRQHVERHPGDRAPELICPCVGRRRLRATKETK
jgi:hypothetical protein